jgi:hypothetical protein
VCWVAVWAPGISAAREPVVEPMFDQRVPVAVISLEFARLCPHVRRPAKAPRRTLNEPFADGKRRNQRIAAGVVGIAVFVAAVWIVATVRSLDRPQAPVPGAGTTGKSMPSK